MNSEPNPEIRLVEDHTGLRSKREINYRALLDSSFDVIWQVELSAGVGKSMYVSPSLFSVFGWRPEEVHDNFLPIIFPEHSRIAIKADIQDMLGGCSSASTLEVAGVHKDGSELWLENKVRVLYRSADLVNVVVTMRDITERKQLERKLQRLAATDGLTGLANRRAFDETLLEEWARLTSGSGPLSLILIDIDHFKWINDRHGHQVGDDCLRTVGEVLKRVMAGTFVARYGGEELAVILPGIHSSEALEYACKACDAIRKLGIPALASASSSRSLTVSCGVATAVESCGGSIVMPEGLLTAADRALYQAKAEGRDRAVPAFLLTAAVR